MPRKSSPKSQKVQAEPKDTVLEKVLKDWQTSWEYTSSSWHPRWEENSRLYNGNRVRRGYEGISDTFIPMAFSTVETMVAGLFGVKPKFNYLPPQDRPDQKTDILNGLVDFYWEKDGWSLKTINTGRNMFKLGTAVDYFAWAGDRPKMINVPIRDFFIDPTAMSLETARYCGRRYLTTKEELDSFEVIDLDNPIVMPTTDELGQVISEPTYDMKKKYKNLDKLDEYRTLEKTDKEEKDMWYGSTLTNPPEGQVEVIEYWTEDKTISVANRSVVIEDAENYFKAKAKANGVEFPRGILPFADARDYVDESLFYAKGEIDFIADQQEMLNDLSNQYIDAITYALNPMFTLDPKYSHLLSEIESLPGAGYPVEKDALNWQSPPVIPNDVALERQNIKNEMREATASNEVIKGVSAEDGSTTATEINAQVAGAGQRLNLKVTQIENGYFQRVGKIVFEMIKLYVTEPMMVQILGKDGARWEMFNPAEFQGDYEPRVQLDISIEQKKREDAAQAKEMLAAFLNDMDVNQQELKKLVLQRSFGLDPDEVEALMQPQMPMGGMLPEEMMGAEMPVEPPDPVAQLFQPQEPQGVEEPII